MLGDFGTFMVLTGTSIHGKDAINVGIAELLID
jgi:enoyl-CoA hydratase/carnithine racemase